MNTKEIYYILRDINSDNKNNNCNLFWANDRKYEFLTSDHENAKKYFSLGEIFQENFDDEDDYHLQNFDIIRVEVQFIEIHPNKIATQKLEDNSVV